MAPDNSSCMFSWSVDRLLMTPFVRTVSIVACVLGLCLWGWEVWQPYGDLGLKSESQTRSITFTGDPETITVVSGGPASLAGLRTGDTVLPAALAPADRWAYIGRTMPGQHIRIIARRNAGPLSFDVVARANSDRIRSVIFRRRLDVLWMIAFALLLLVRGKSSARARMLGVILLCWGIGNELWRVHFWSPWLPLNVTAEWLDKMTDMLEVVVGFWFVQTFGRPSRMQTLLGRVACASALGYTGLITVSLASTVAGAPTTLGPTAFALLDCAYVLFAASVGFAIASAANERGALLWAAIPLVALMFTDGYAFFIGIFVPGWAPSLPAVGAVTTVGWYFMPAGVTYSVLSRRVIDLGFVLNRTLVYSGVTFVLVGTFTLAEWILATWFESATKLQNTAISAGIAILLGFSVRIIHQRVDRIVDVVFFRKRHANEEAIRAFGEEAPYITDVGALLDRTERTLRERSEAATVAVLVQGDDGRFGAIDENDPAIVRMKARRAMIDLSKLETELPGAHAFPLVARGRLIGAIALGSRTTGEFYTPDEIRAIGALADGVAMGLDLMRSQHENRSTHEIVAALHQLRSDFRSDLAEFLQIVRK